MGVWKNHDFRPISGFVSEPYCKTDMRKFFFSYKVINRWNSLPDEAIQVDWINSFKEHLQKIYSTRMGFFVD